MSYFIAIEGINGPKAIPALYRTMAEAKHELLTYYSTQTGTFKIMDADHEPGRSILKARHRFT